MGGMEQHHSRYLIILAAFVVTVLGLVGCLALGVEDGQVIAALVTAAGLLAPALVDSHMVEQRRKDPLKAPVKDNVTLRARSGS